MKVKMIPITCLPLANKLNEESKLCFCVAAACFLVGSCGWLVNKVLAKPTTFDSLLVVAAIYLLLGTVSLAKREPVSADASELQTLISKSNNSDKEGKIENESMHQAA